MAANMNERELRLSGFLVLVIFFSAFRISASSTTPPDSNVSTEASTAFTTPIPTTVTTTVTTTTTTTISPIQSPTALDTNSLIGQCPCDLTGNACDVNCCCDGDCTADDKLTFSQCIPFPANVDNRLCLRNEIIAFENSDPVVSEVTDNDLFCIYYDNKKERNYYTNPSSVQTLEAFEEYRREFPSFSFQSPAISSINLNSSFYKSGDPIYTVYQSQAIGVLGLPQTLTAAECVDGNPAAYLLDQAHSCVRRVATSNCQPGGMGLDLNNFITGFRVVTSPQLFQEFETAVPGTNNFYSLYNNSLTIAVEMDTTTSVSPFQCFDEGSGLTGPCTYSIDPLPVPSLGANSCNQVVKEVHYKVITGGTAGIVRVLARFVLTNLTLPTSSSALFVQSFSTEFEDSGASDGFQRSGNPGYVAGQPVLAGTLNQTAADPTVYQILISSNRDRYMTVVKTLPSGDCITDSDSRVSVVFGQSVRTGCVLRVSASNLTQYCALMQQKIIEVMEFESIPEITANGFRITNYYVGQYGNSDVSKPGDWVRVVYQNRPVPTMPPSGATSCQLSLGMHIQILYSNIGALINPQAKIIGVSFIYDNPQSVQIRPTLTGVYNQPVEVTSSVAFTDVSQPAVGSEGEAPIFLAKLPYDFFYPFISGATGPRPVLVNIFPVILSVWLLCCVL